VAADVVERFGRFHRVPAPGVNVIVPVADRVRAKVDMREQVLRLDPQQVVTSDGIPVDIGVVLYYRVVEPRAALYQVANFITAIAELARTTLDDAVDVLDLEAALAGRAQLRQRLRAEFDESTYWWGVSVTRVEIKGIEPPASIRRVMEKAGVADLERELKELGAAAGRTAGGSVPPPDEAGA
jgi:regulator of protease activity HflC (stomatin/prohibitin superfamily)